MATLHDYLRRVIPALAGFLLGVLLLRLWRGDWQWGLLLGPLFGAAVILVITVVRVRLDEP